MDGEKRERWKQLCELAQTEQDPAQLAALIEEINRLLEEREQRVKAARSGSKP